MLGYDPGEFPRYLMKLCSNLFVEDQSLTDARDLLMKAFDILQNITCYGINLKLLQIFVSIYTVI